MSILLFVGKIIYLHGIILKNKISNGGIMNEIAVNVLSECCANIVNSVIEKTKDTIIGWDKKKKIDLRKSFFEYLSFCQKNNSKIKTLLYRNIPKDLYSFYECVGVKCDKKIVDTATINNLLKINKRIVITGTGGIGKSIMLKHFFLNTIRETAFVPVLIELRNIEIENEFSLKDYLYETLSTFKLKLDKEYFEYSLEKGCYVFLLDGYDEVKSIFAKKVMKEIINMSNKYPENFYVVSSRPQINFTGWGNFVEMKALDLTKDQALSLIKKLDFDEKIKDSFYNETKNYLFDRYEGFMSNPLLLTIMLLTFENRASIPDRLNDFYEQAFSALFYRHDASKGAYKRDIASNLGYEDFRKVFSYFCFKSFFNDQYSFTERESLDYIEKAIKRNIIDKKFSSLDFFYDLKNSVCMLICEGNEYKFIHRSFQEYFAAVYTTQLSDEVQKKLLVEFSKTIFSFRNSYYYMLYWLQENRFIKNFLYPELKKIIDSVVLKNENDSLEWEIFKSLNKKVRFVKSEDRVNIFIRSPRASKYKDMLFELVSELQNSNQVIFMGRKAFEITEKLFLIYGGNDLISIETLEKNGDILEIKFIFKNTLARIKKAIKFVKEIEAKEKPISDTLEILLDEI